MGVNISQNSATESNHEGGPFSFGTSHGQGPTADQFSYTQEPNAEEACKTQVDPALRYSADNLETSVHASGQMPEYGAYLMPTPSVTSESWETVGASWRNIKPNADSHAAAPPFPMPSHFSEPQYGMSGNVLIQFFVTFINLN